MSEKLLKEYVSQVLQERETFSMTGYSTPAQGDFAHTFLMPFKDLFDTGEAVVASMANTHLSAIKRLLSRIIYDIMPDVMASKIIPRIDEITRKEKEYAEKIRHKYGEVLERNSKELFRGDAAMFAFLAAPAKFLSGAVLLKAPESVGRFIRTLAAERQFRDKRLRGPIKTLLGHLRAAVSTAASSRIPKVREGVLAEREISREQHLQAAKQILSSPEIQAALKQHFAAPHKEVGAMLSSLEREIKRDYHDMSGTLASSLGSQIAERFSQDLEGESSELPDLDMGAIQGAARDALQATYLQALKQKLTQERDPAYRAVFESLIKDLSK